VNVAIFTDNDFDKVNGVTTTLSAVLRCAPREMRLRIYTAALVGVEQPDYLALRSFGVPIPFYGEMRMYIPRLLAFVARARADRIDVVHLTTPGPVGLAALYVAWRLGLPLVGSFHTDLAAYTALLSGSPRLGALMREYMRWPYGKCARVLVPSHHTRALLVGAKGNAEKIHVWSRGVDTDLFTPQKRSAALREAWHVSDNRPALLYVGRVSREKGLALLAPLRDRLHAAGIEHRFVIAGQGPMISELRRQLPDAVFTGVLSRAAVADAFASADAFVFPSRTDTAGNVVLEAQASGLPVIVSSDGGPRENIIEGTTGLVCQTDHPSEWSAAVARALGQSTGAAAGLGAEAPAKTDMRTAARAYATTRRWEQALQPLYRAYVECVQAASDTPSHRVTEKALSA
jgi:glycosyltransferase involved in cell wall biosynthesis